MIAEVSKNTHAAKVMAKPLKRGKVCMNCRYARIIYAWTRNPIYISSKVSKNLEPLFDEGDRTWKAHLNFPKM